jgi:hypothetical protein
MSSSNVTTTFGEFSLFLSCKISLTEGQLGGENETMTCSSVVHRRQQLHRKTMTSLESSEHVRHVGLFSAHTQDSAVGAMYRKDGDNEITVLASRPTF